jgi:hypothetical protein
MVEDEFAPELSILKLPNNNENNECKINVYTKEV